MTKVSQDRRYELVDLNVTLNGNPARISGALCKFATITELRHNLGVEFAWSTVERIVMSRNRVFKS